MKHPKRVTDSIFEACFLQSLSKSMAYFAVFIPLDIDPQVTDVAECSKKSLCIGNNRLFMEVPEPILTIPCKDLNLKVEDLSIAKAYVVNSVPLDASFGKLADLQLTVLKTLGLIIHPYSCATVCLECNAPFWRMSSVISHLGSHSIPLLVPKTHQFILGSVIEKMESFYKTNRKMYRKPGMEALHCIPMVAIFDGFRCKVCSSMKIKKTAIVKHMRASHLESQADEFVGCLVQNLYRGNVKSLFSVKLHSCQVLVKLSDFEDKVCENYMNQFQSKGVEQIKADTAEGLRVAAGISACNSGDVNTGLLESLNLEDKSVISRILPVHIGHSCSVCKIFKSSAAEIQCHCEDTTILDHCFNANLNGTNPSVCVALITDSSSFILDGVADLKHSGSELVLEKTKRLKTWESHICKTLPYIDNMEDTVADLATHEKSERIDAEFDIPKISEILAQFDIPTKGEDCDIPEKSESIIAKSCIPENSEIIVVDYDDSDKSESAYAGFGISENSQTNVAKFDDSDKSDSVVAELGIPKKFESIVTKFDDAGKPESIVADINWLGHAEIDLSLDFSASFSSDEATENLYQSDLNKGMHEDVVTEVMSDKNVPVPLGSPEETVLQMTEDKVVLPLIISGLIDPIKIDSLVLNGFGVILYKPLGIVICKTCHFGISNTTAGIKNHFKNIHGMAFGELNRGALQEVEKFVEEFGVNLCELETLMKSGGRFNPIPNIKVTSGFICPVAGCQHCFVAKAENMARHLEFDHLSCVADFSTIERVEVQQIYRFKGVTQNITVRVYDEKPNGKSILFVPGREQCTGDMQIVKDFLKLNTPANKVQKCNIRQIEIEPIKTEIITTKQIKCNAGLAVINLNKLIEEKEECIPVPGFYKTNTKPSEGTALTNSLLHAKIGKNDILELDMIATDSLNAFLTPFLDPNPAEQEFSDTFFGTVLLTLGNKYFWDTLKKKFLLPKATYQRLIIVAICCYLDYHESERHVKLAMKILCEELIIPSQLINKFLRVLVAFQVEV